MTSIGHIHEFGSTVKIDRCHATELQRICSECGQRSIRQEARDFREPGQVAFADPTCWVCRERVALDGVIPACWGEI
jgi:hypothetical protein